MLQVLLHFRSVIKFQKITLKQHKTYYFTIILMQRAPGVQAEGTNVGGI